MQAVFTFYICTDLQHSDTYPILNSRETEYLSPESILHLVLTQSFFPSKINHNWMKYRKKVTCFFCLQECLNPCEPVCIFLCYPFGFTPPPMIVLLLSVLKQNAILTFVLWHRSFVICTYLTESCIVLHMNIKALMTTGSLVCVNWYLK